MAFVADRYDAVHTNVLNHAEVSEVFLTESHPKTRTLDGGIILYETFDFFMVKEVRLTRTDVGVSKRLVNFEGFGFHPLTIFPIKTLLRDFANVNFGIEVRSKRLTMVTRVTVNDIEVMDFVEVVLRSVSGVNRSHTGVETTTKNCGKSGLLKAFFVCPLPRILEVCFILGFVVCRVEIRTTELQTSLHNREVLIGECEVHYEVGLKLVKECHQFGYVVGIYLSSLDVRIANRLNDSVTLRLRAACNHDFIKHVRVLRHLVRCNSGYASCANDKNFSHFVV